MTASSSATPAATGPIFRRVLGNAGKLLGGRTVNAGLSLAYMALAARALGVQTFGVLVLIHALAQFLSDVVKFQSWQTVLQYGAEPLAEGRVADLQRVVRFTALLDALSGLAGVALGVAAAFLFAEQLGLPAADAPLAASYAASIGFMTAATPMGVLRLLDRFEIMAAELVVVSMVRLLGCGVGFLLHAPLPFFLLVWALGSLAGFAFVTAGAWRALRRHGLLGGFAWRGPLTLDVPGAWRFAWATNVNATLSVAFTHLVTLLVGGLLGPAEAALWRVGRQVADAIAKPVKLLTPALYPELARLRASREERAMWRLARHIGLAAGGVGLLLLAVSAFAGAPLLRLIMGAGFESAAGVMTWQVAAAVIGMITLPLEPMVISLGQAGGAVRVRLAVALGFVVFLPPLVRRFGIDAAGAALVAASAAVPAGLLWLLLRRRSGAESHKSA